jgi:hypothetical protein
MRTSTLRQQRDASEQGKRLALFASKALISLARGRASRSPTYREASPYNFENKMFWKKTLLHWLPLASIRRVFMGFCFEPVRGTDRPSIALLADSDGCERTRG